MLIDVSKIIITPEMVNLIAEIDQFKGAWQLFGRLKPERLQQLKKVATIESVGSSTRIEGSKLSDSEVEKLLLNLDKDSYLSRDEQEVRGYAYACEAVFQNYEYMNFSENMIKEMHAWVLKFSDKDERHRGEYKKIANNVEAFDSFGRSLGIIVETSSPFETPIQMEELCRFVKDQLENKMLHPLIMIGIFVVIFLAIHPFQDGNGRLSRVLTTWGLLKTGYLYSPYSSLESIIERSKESYYVALKKTQNSLKSEIQNFEPWLLFFLRSLQKQKSHLEVKINREKAFLSLPKLLIEILELVHEQGRLNINEIEKLTGANRNTLKKALKTLTSDGHLTMHGKGRATWYVL